MNAPFLLALVGVQEDKDYDRAVAVLAKAKLVEAMQINALQRLRTVYLQRCVENIGASASVCSSLSLFRAIAELLPPRPVAHDSQARKGVLVSLENRFKLVTLFFDDLKRFKQDASAALDAVPIPQRNDAVVSPASKVPFLQQIRDRLSFLGFFLSESLVPVTIEHVDKLWGLCVADGSRLTPQEQDVVLEVRDGVYCEKWACWGCTLAGPCV